MGEDVLGREVRFTLTGCDRDILDSLTVIRTLVRDMCEVLRVHIKSLHEERFEPQGVSVVAILAESHAAVHTWPELGSATIDIFSCGEVDPSSTLPLVARTLRATGSSMQFGERSVEVAPKMTRYHRFEQYLLRPTPGGHFAPPVFRRGIGREFMMEPEALAWQEFFCSAEYQPPSGQDILLLHPCTWAKPYDMSAFITLLRGVTDKHPRVHRAIISNVGVVPFEYQMNPFFCSYDYSPVGKLESVDESEGSATIFAKLASDRIRRYLEAHTGDYSAVVLLGHPLVSSLRTQVQEIARSTGLSGFAVPTPDAYLVSQSEAEGNADVDAPLFMPTTLAQLDRRLIALLAHLDGVVHHG
ncbi:adenosylmethionine decarboxylase [Propioniciclava sp. MC1683]|uniref:adenosylmethionine decarboxylase n=1 Tax=Propioniciclava sp. MC1683 TaxID=2760309 RepID=UPI0015FF481F|nr:adenosylmethionine decarboxylase [Propioniciclava sp. MC1683]MBB1501866.1 adenosylmethionine decarboxylase [Propioniciclava sp. MC1683]